MPCALELYILICGVEGPCALELYILICGVEGALRFGTLRFCGLEGALRFGTLHINLRCRGALRFGTLHINLRCRGALRFGTLHINLRCRGALCFGTLRFCGLEGALCFGTLHINLRCRGALRFGTLHINLRCRGALRFGTLHINLRCRGALRFGTSRFCGLEGVLGFGTSLSFALDGVTLSNLSNFYAVEGSLGFTRFCVKRCVTLPNFSLFFWQVEDAIQTSPCGEKTAPFVLIVFILFSVLTSWSLLLDDVVGDLGCAMCFRTLLFWGGGWYLVLSDFIFLLRGHLPVPKSSHFVPHTHPPRTGSDFFCAPSR